MAEKKSTSLIAHQLGVGDRAPNFTTIDDKENSLSLTDFHGKTVVLYFYPRDNTPGCTQEANDFTVQMSKFTEHSAVVLGVSRDSLKSHCRFRDKFSITFPLLVDEDEEICNLYGVMKDKNMYGKKVRGIQRSTFVINKSGIIDKVWRGVKVPGHVEDVLAVVKSQA